MSSPSGQGHGPTLAQIARPLAPVMVAGPDAGKIVQALKPVEG